MTANQNPDLEGGLAEQLHLWYLEATQKLNPDSYNSNAQKPYSELTDDQKFIDQYIADKVARHNQKTPEGVSSGMSVTYDYSTTKHDVPCEDCGSYEWQDWLLKPDKLFNELCPGGEGYLCFPCFLARHTDKAIEKSKEAR